MIVEPADIPYGELTLDLFRDTPAQRVIPFLGAGVSTSAKETGPEAEPKPQDPRVALALSALETRSTTATGDVQQVTLDNATRLYAEIALEMALAIQQMRDAPVDMDLLDRLKDDRYPPSASQLVDWLSASSGYKSFEDVISRVSSRLGRQLDSGHRADLLALLRAIAGLAGIAQAPLASLSTFFEAVNGRKKLLDRLSEILANKSTPTPTHDVVARAAKWHLGKERRRGETMLPAGIGHYLIMTTNYDCLMEQALQVPYVVLSMSNEDFLVRGRFGNMTPEWQAAFERANPPRAASKFDIAVPPPSAVSGRKGQEAQAPSRLAMVYKVHGCIRDWLAGERNDSVVISDNDYVTNISRFSDNDGVIPSCVSSVLNPTGSLERPWFLYMGYSLRDWNVRGMLRAVRAKRAGKGNENQDYGDWTVIRNFGQMEKTFFLQHHTRIIHEDLTTFSTAIGAAASSRYRA